VWQRGAVSMLQLWSCGGVWGSGLGTVAGNGPKLAPDVGDLVDWPSGISWRRDGGRVRQSRGTVWK